MEASNLVRSGSFHNRSGSFRFPRSTSVGKLASPRTTKCHVVPRGGKVLRRARSEADLIGTGSRPAPLMSLPIQEDEENAMADLKTRAFTVQGMTMITEEEPVKGMKEEERDVFGGGMGKGDDGNRGGKGGRGSGDQSENRRIHDRYKELLRSDPGNPLLLRNYGKFLHEVEGDVKGAEECYGRAILASPGDGEVLMLYGMLVWENYGDKERAGAYLQRATEASPHDCMVLAAYAKFLWEIGDEEDEDSTDSVTSFQSLVAAF
ncbi:Tetratricopeptide repeat (TPR)-like superfamily protein [Rhynchospora pubera]|uniref:Tetratricopeptide repeat (TPR)-like superfamily protein n=1 Tax=Rhynchospora pubera TaxID=906938 RepID=A0AAV8E595_9POAL|nr:Tetratricopeptide repeat (TPR)-like superfamily protein [Rhynchospora pubera]